MDQQQTIEYIKKYVEDLMAFFDLNITAEVSIEGDILIVKVPSTQYNSLLIGRGAETLRSIQHLLSALLRNSNAAVERVNLDIADYKQQHAEKLTEKARGWFQEVRDTGESKTLDLNAADRWTVHHAAHDFDDIETHSEGEGRDRRLVISLKD
jgi:SpoIIIJ-associated protein